MIVSGATTLTKVPSLTIPETLRCGVGIKPSSVTENRSSCLLLAEAEV